MPSAVCHSHGLEGFDKSTVPQKTPLSKDASEAIPLHPLGVKPLGNQYFSKGPVARSHIGAWAILPDEVLMVVLESLDKYALLRLGSASRFLYAFCHADELWKALFLEFASDKTPPSEWYGSWRSTVLGVDEKSQSGLKVDCSGVFSDVLHRPFACSNAVPARFAQNIPGANQIRKLDNMSHEEFAERWTQQPFILTQCIREWLVMSEWTIDRLLQDFGDTEFRAEAVDWPFSLYYKYMENNKDESPLYLFDRKFAEKMNLKVGPVAGAAYRRPSCFGPDFFEVLGDERPAHRWLIVGPERSGSTFHKDPNGTSAWNAVIQGSKYWIMFPPEAQVPGVYVSKDSSEVTSPLSIAEWLLTFHAEARLLPSCVEGICNAGEILHVPSGWWHLVVNLESGIALTQNFVPQSPNLAHLSTVLSFLRDKPDQVSGFSQDIDNPYGLFVSRLEQKHPEALERALDILEKQGCKKRKWDSVVNKGEDKESNGFSFGFGGGDDDDDIP